MISRLKNLFGRSESDDETADEDKRIEKEVVDEMTVSDPRDHTNMEEKPGEFIKLESGSVIQVNVSTPITRGIGFGLDGKKFSGSFTVNGFTKVFPKMLAPDGGKEWTDARKKTPSDTERLPKRGTKGREERYRESLEGIGEVARERFDFLVEAHNFTGMPPNNVMIQWGIEYLGSGNFRTVYGFEPDSKVPLDDPEDYVLKVCSNHEEWTNEEEVKAYTRLEDTPIEDYLAPVIDFGTDYEWVLMKRADTDSQLKQEKVWDLREECKELGWSYGDWAPRNCGYIDGEPVLVDYGYHNSVDKKLEA